MAARLIVNFDPTMGDLARKPRLKAVTQKAGGWERRGEARARGTGILLKGVVKTTLRRVRHFASAPLIKAINQCQLAGSRTGAQLIIINN